MNITPTWTPTAPHQTRLFAFQQFVETHYHQSFAHYNELHAWSIQHIPLFWEAVSRFFELPFHIPTSAVLQKKGPQPWDNLWFEGAQLNYAQQLLQGSPDQPALICIDETNHRRVYTYADLKLEVAACATGLKQAGVNALDRVAAVLPNRAETIIAMLATASIGAIWSSCSPDFGVEAILARFKQINPTVLFIADGQRYNGKIFPIDSEKIRHLQHELPSLKRIVMVPVVTTDIAELPTDLSIAWSKFLIPTETFDPPHFPFSHPMLILFSSGTTGKPKCIIHGAGNTLIQHLKELALHSNLSAQDRFFFYTTCGWMMWNWMVSGLALKLTLILYDGAPLYPDASKLFSLIEQEKVTAFGTSAKYLAAIEKAELKPSEAFDLTSLRLILSTGSPLLAPQYDFVYKSIHPDLQLSSISGGTDIVSCFALGNPMLPVYRGEIQCIGLGMNVQVFDPQGKPILNKKGELVCASPFPSMPLGFWQDQNNTAYQQAYFDRFQHIWAHGDFAEITTHQGLIIYGRSDATLNRGGVRIGTAEIYHEIDNIPEIMESVVIGQSWQDDIRVILFVKLKPLSKLDDTLKQTICHRLKHNASPRHVPDLIIEVPDIPKTFSGKIVEMAIRQTILGESIQNLNAIANPEALAYFKERPELMMEVSH